MPQLEVVDKISVADRVVQVEFRCADGAALPAWQPGAHIEIDLDGTRRQYSLCGPVDAQTWRIAVLWEDPSRGGSEYVHTRLRKGDRLTASEPRNHFAFDGTGPTLFLAGGIGITPLLPMIERAQRTGIAWRLVYGGRSAASMAFVADLRDSYPDRVEIRPQDVHGLLDVDSLCATAASVDQRVYCCGPTGLIDAVEDAGRRHRIEVRTERFRAAETAPGADESFTVEIADTGQRIHVDADVSMLDALRDSGIDLPSSCEEGTCGTCEIRIVDGAAIHRDSVLSEAERAEQIAMMPCVSRASGEFLRVEI